MYRGTFKTGSRENEFEERAANKDRILGEMSKLQGSLHGKLEDLHHQLKRVTEERDQLRHAMEGQSVLGNHHRAPTDLGYQDALKDLALAREQLAQSEDMNERLVDENSLLHAKLKVKANEIDALQAAATITDRRRPRTTRTRGRNSQSPISVKPMRSKSRAVSDKKRLTTLLSVATYDDAINKVSILLR
jgi:hypothetical protein